MTKTERVRTDEPKPAPFPAGTRLRYKGTREITQGHSGGPMVKVLYPGIEVTIKKTAYGHQGTGKVVDHDEETGEAYHDETRDFVSVYYQEHGEGRCISHDSADEWEVIK